MSLPSSPIPQTSDWIDNARPWLNNIRAYLADKFNPLPDGTTIQVTYPGTGGWPARPTTRPDIPVWWIGGPESLRPAGAKPGDVHLPNAE